MKKEKIITIVLSVLVVLMVALVVVQNTVGLEKLFGGKSVAAPSPGRRGGGNGGQNAVNVEVQKASLSTFIKTINVNGELTYKDSERNVIADTSGKITEILVRRGDFVVPGQVVAKADPSTPGAEYRIKEITSTVSGQVTSVPAYIGLTVSANTTVITVANPKELVLKLNIPEKYLSSFTIGSKASFVTAAYPDSPYTGKVCFIDSMVNTSTRTVQVEIEIDNPDERLMAGMFVRSCLVIEEKENVFVVPSECLSTYLNNQTVYVVKNGKAERVNVSTGSYNDSQTVITSGISEGDIVIVLGQVTDGSSVNIINAEKAGIEASEIQTSEKTGERETQGEKGSLGNGDSFEDAGERGNNSARGEERDNRSDNTGLSVERKGSRGENSGTTPDTNTAKDSSVK